MAIQVLTASLADQPQQVSQDLELANNFKDNLADLLACYFKINESPSDAQVHALATSIGFEPEGLEQIIYSMFGEEISDEEPYEEHSSDDLGSDILAPADEGFKDFTMAKQAAAAITIDKDTKVKDLLENLDEDLTEELETADDFLLPMSSLENASSPQTISDDEVLIDDGSPIDDLIDDAEQQALNNDGDLVSKNDNDSTQDALNDDGVDVSDLPK